MLYAQKLLNKVQNQVEVGITEVTGAMPTAAMKALLVMPSGYFLVQAVKFGFLPTLTQEVGLDIGT